MNKVREDTIRVVFNLLGNEGGEGRRPPSDFIRLKQQIVDAGEAVDPMDVTDRPEWEQERKRRNGV